MAMSQTNNCTYADEFGCKRRGGCACFGTSESGAYRSTNTGVIHSTWTPPKEEEAKPAEVQASEARIPQPYASEHY